MLDDPVMRESSPGPDRLPEMIADTREVRSTHAAGDLARLSSRPDRRRSGSTFGVAVPDRFEIESYRSSAAAFYDRVLLGCVAAAARREQAVALLPGSVAPTSFPRPFDGVVVVDPLPGSRDLTTYLELDLPVVTVGRDDDHPQVPSAVNSFFDGVCVLLAHLRRRGATTVLLVVPRTGCWWTDLTPGLLRTWEQSHGIALTVAEIAFDQVIAPQDAAARVRDTVRGRLLTSDRPQAVVVFLPPWAPVVLEEARALGLRVPDDLLVASTMDSPVLASPVMSVTSMDIRSAVLGETAVALLDELVSTGRALRPHVDVTAELVVRSSTDQRARR